MHSNWEPQVGSSVENLQSWGGGDSDRIRGLSYDISDFPQLQDPSIWVNEGEPTKHGAEMALGLLTYVSESRT